MISTFVFMGRPGSGKGTQAKLLSEFLGYEYFGTGQWLREAKVQDGPLAHLIADTVDNGYLMQHWFVSYMVTNTLLDTMDKPGLVLDGSNRTREEAEFFYEQMEWLKRDYRVMYLDVDEATIINRLTSRGGESQREDDAVEKLHVRVQEYDNKTASAREFINSKGKMIHIDGNRPVDEVQADIRSLISQL